MKCPYCDVDMLEGYLNCGTAIWSTRKHKISMSEQYPSTSTPRIRTQRNWHSRRKKRLLAVPPSHR